jgi:hypothetical protein
LKGVGKFGKGFLFISFKGAKAVRSVWMDTVHAYAHQQCAARRWQLSQS